MDDNSSFEEICRCLPAMKSGIAECLHNLSGVRNYPEIKMQEFREILREREEMYRKWMKRAKELNPECEYTPGSAHEYFSKKAELRKKRSRAAWNSSSSGDESDSEESQEKEKVVK